MFVEAMDKMTNPTPLVTNAEKSYFMKLIVLAKQVPDSGGTRKLDPETGILDRTATEAVPDEITERALECALQVKDQNTAVEVVVLTVGPVGAENSIRQLLAMGADRAVHIVDDSLMGADMLQTARVITAALEKERFDLVLAGDQSTDGRGGMLPSIVAGFLDVPILPDLEEIDITQESVRGSMKTETSELRLESAFPAVAAVTERVAEARFPNFKGIRAAKKKPVEVLSLSDLGCEVDPINSSTRSVMVSAIPAQPKSGGTKLIDDGTSVEQLAAFLESKHLI